MTNSFSDYRHRFWYDYRTWPKPTEIFFIYPQFLIYFSHNIIILSWFLYNVLRIIKIDFYLKKKTISTTLAWISKNLNSPPNKLNLNTYNFLGTGKMQKKSVFLLIQHPSSNLFWEILLNLKLIHFETHIYVNII